MNKISFFFHLKKCKILLISFLAFLFSKLFKKKNANENSKFPPSQDMSIIIHPYLDKCLKATVVDRQYKKGQISKGKYFDTRDNQKTLK